MYQLSMAIVLKLIFFLLLSDIGVLASSLRQNSCGESLYLEPGHIHYFTSPDFPEPYQDSKECTWTVEMPAGTSVRLFCPIFDLSSSYKCRGDRLTVSLNDFSYCGNENVEFTTDTNEFSVIFNSQHYSPDIHKGFLCILVATGVYDNADASSTTAFYETEDYEDYFQTDDNNPSTTIFDETEDGGHDFQTDDNNPSTTVFYETEDSDQDFQTDDNNPSTTIFYETEDSGQDTQTEDNNPSTTIFYETEDSDQEFQTDDSNPSTTIFYETEEGSQDFQTYEEYPTSATAFY